MDHTKLVIAKVFSLIFLILPIFMNFINRENSRERFHDCRLSQAETDTTVVFQSVLTRRMLHIGTIYRTVVLVHTRYEIRSLSERDGDSSRKIGFLFLLMQ